jgi:tetratricopeptide (TPR) repeat protein
MEDRAEQYFKEGGDFIRHGRHEEAVDSFDKAIAIDPNLTEAKENREIALKKQT